jgi:hypothetical protein
VIALLSAANALPRRPKLVSSVRDVLQRPRKSERALGMVAYAQAHYDMILVHGDQSIVPAEASFPEIERVSGISFATRAISAASQIRRPGGVTKCLFLLAAAPSAMR